MKNVPKPKSKTVRIDVSDISIDVVNDGSRTVIASFAYKIMVGSTIFERDIMELNISDIRDRSLYSEVARGADMSVRQRAVRRIVESLLYNMVVTAEYLDGATLVKIVTPFALAQPAQQVMDVIADRIGVPCVLGVR